MTPSSLVVETVADLPPPTLHVLLSDGERLVGSLYRRPGMPPIFAYGSDVEPQEAVSLTMPVADARQYEAPQPLAVHPVFEMNLPEGEMRQVLEKTFSRHFPAWDDCALLGIVGRSMIGRLAVLPPSEQRGLTTPPPPLRLQELLEVKNSRGLFASLLERYAAYAGVSGVQPKFLVQDDSTARLDDPTISAGPTARRMTATGTTHIVKSADFDRFPSMVANEYVCLKTAQMAGLEIPEISLSEDGAILAVKRFDLAAEVPEGAPPTVPSYFGFEDLCALAGLRTHQKYSGSYEQVAKIIRSATGENAFENLAQFFRSVVFQVVIRNGDAHRKNFGVLYSDPTRPARLAPTYDVLTTCIYGDDNMLALTLDGTRRWPDRKRLLRFGLNSCGLTNARASQIVDEVTGAVSYCQREWLLGTSAEEASHHLSDEVRKGMADAWEEGLIALCENVQTTSLPSSGEVNSKRARTR